MAIPKYVTNLIKVYQVAQFSLVQTISEKEARGNLVNYENSLLSQVEFILSNTNRYAAEWANDVIPGQYKNGVNSAVSGLGKYNIEVPGYEAFARIHNKAVGILVRNAIEDLTDASSFVGRQVNDSVRKAGLEAIAQKLSTGGTVREAKKNLQKALVDQGLNGIRDKRGRMISLDAYASTVARSTTRETTNTAMTNHLTSLNYDLVQMSEHGTTCPICAAYEGRVYSITGNTKGYPVLDMAYGGGHANIHPNCVTGETRVSGSPAIGASSRYYEGKMFVINTALGKELTVTPNHPILTPKGWIEPRLLNVGDQIINYVGSEGVVNSVPNDVEIPPTIKDVTRSFGEPSQMSPVSVKITAEDFHGDGIGSEIAIIYSNSLLWNSMNPMLFQKTVKSHFSDANIVHFPFLSECSFDFFGLGMYSTFNSFMSGGSIGLSLFRCHSGISDSDSFTLVESDREPALSETIANSRLGTTMQLGDSVFGHSGVVLLNHQVDINNNGFRTCPHHDALTFEQFRNGFGVNLIDASNLIDSLSGEIKFDDIIGIREIDFSGHVYNLHTKGNWFAANDIITHNCQHVIFPYIPDLADNPQRDLEFSNRSFDIDGRSKAEMNRYNKIQKEKTILRNDRNQYQRYRLALGKDAPKTFAGFRRMKLSDSDRWQELQSDYREVIRD